VIANGLRAVLRWDETPTPASLTVPVRVLAGDANRITRMRRRPPERPESGALRSLPGAPGALASE
jgi:hypothetical protein